jgi:hypothetical protein
VQLKRIYASLRDDMSTPAEWFEVGAANDAAAAASAQQASGSNLSTLIEKGRKSKSKGTAPAPAQAAQAIQGTQPAAPDGSLSPPPDHVTDDPMAMLALLAAGVESAPDRDEAALILDRGRSVLGEKSPEFASLTQVYRVRWGE